MSDFKKNEIPTPNSCGACGNDERSHGYSYALSVGFHPYIAPTSQQRLERMLARHQARA
jgi:hypothetical protein